MKKERLLIVFLSIALMIGIMIILYPTISRYYNSFHQTHVVEKYEENVNKLEKEKYSDELEKARLYNKKLTEKINPFYLNSEEYEEYMRLLNIAGDNIMGYIVIPKINCTVPIYHGTDDNTMQVGIGHIEGSSLPVGGETTHCVLSGHRGLAQSKLFTNLNELKEKDTFSLHVLNEVLEYEVDQILIVEPQEIEALAIEEGKDYCTLVTCTPYAINTHRLLVRGRRIKTSKEIFEYNNEKVEYNLNIQKLLNKNNIYIVLSILVIIIIIIMYIITRKNIKNKK